jgi:RNA polymerase sigma-70 factor (ECF subfamily)
MSLIVLQLEQQRRRLLSYISRRDRLGGQAEDILQEVMLKVLEQSRKQEIGNPIAYAYRVADSIIYSNADRARREAGPPVSDDIASREPLADEVLQHRERVAVFERALHRLTPLQRQVFMLRRIDARSRAEIAAELGLSIEAVKKHLVRAMAELAGAMADGPDGRVDGANGEAGDDR